MGDGTQLLQALVLLPCAGFVVALWLGWLVPGGRAKALAQANERLRKQVELQSVALEADLKEVRYELRQARQALQRARTGRPPVRYVDPKGPPDIDHSFYTVPLGGGGRTRKELIELPRLGSLESAYVEGGAGRHLPPGSSVWDYPVGHAVVGRRIGGPKSHALPFADGRTPAVAGADAVPGQPACLCGHSVSAHLDKDADWSICVWCDCLGYAAPKED